MSITRAEVELVLIRRCGRKLALVELDGATADGTNPDLADPIAAALRELGLAVAGVAPTDADLAPVGPSQVAGLLDVAELRVLESVLGNWDQPDQTADTDNQQALGKLYDSLEKTVARKRLQVERQYGIGGPTLTAGTIDLGFAATTGWPR